MSSHTQTFNLKSFYGAKCRKRRYEIKSLIEQQVKKQSKYSLPENFKSRIGGPSSSWKIFFKQNEAFKFAQSTSEDQHVFSYEKEVVGEEIGQRLFLVTSYPVFWHYYRQLSGDKKHHYEIIAEGTVCKMYFDLEYLKEYNPDSVGDEMVQLFIKYVCFWLKKKFDVCCDVSDVLNLEASTEHKFSRHLIFQLKNAAFKDNIQLGYFIREIMEVLEDVIKYKDELSDSGIDISVEDTHGSHLGNKQTNNVEDSLRDARFDKGQTTLENTETTRNETGTLLKNAESEAEENNLQDIQTNKVESRLNNVDSDTRETTPADSENIKGNNMHSRQQTNNMEDNLSNVAFDKREATLAASRNTKESLQQKSSHVQDGIKKKELSQGEITLDNLDKNQDIKQPSNTTDDNPENDDVHHGSSHQFKSDSRLKELNEVLEVFTVDELQSLFIYDKHGNHVPFVDTGVYTKNRNFRLYLSSKLGKNNPLVLSADNKFLYSTQEDLFLSSLISNVSYTDKLRILKFSDDERNNKNGVCFGGRSKNTEATLDGERSSPYPEIDHYINTIINRGDHHGYVRHWTYFNHGELLIYDIAKYRFCENINRSHRSNNIMYIVDIRRGVYYQKCHDPDCKKQDFKSQEHEIPKEYLPAFLLEQDDSMSNSDDDDLLLQAMENVENFNAENSDSKNFADCDLSDDELMSITNEMEKSSDEVHME